jgi:hypothetical protein
MDPISIASIAAPFVVKGAEAFSKAAGEKLGGKMDELYQAVINKFKEDSYAEQTLARAKEKPETEGRQRALKEVLAEKMEDDSDFFENIQKIVEEIERDRTPIFDQSKQNVSGPQTNIGGDVKGNVYSGAIRELKIENKLNELDKVDDATRVELINTHAEQIKQSPEKAKYHLALGLDYLDKGLYSMAIDSLSKAHERAPLNANVFFYLALANMGGKQPRSLTLSTILEIEGYLNNAIKLDPSKAHYLYLLALIKYDFYDGNGYDITPPYPDEIINAAEQATYVHSEIKQIIKHIQIPECPLCTRLLSRW